MVEHIFHVGSGFKFKSIIPAGPMIVGGDGGSQGRQMCFFTALDPVEEPQNYQPDDERERECDKMQFTGLNWKVFRIDCDFRQSVSSSIFLTTQYQLTAW